MPSFWKTHGIDLLTAVLMVAALLLVKSILIVQLANIFLLNEHTGLQKYKLSWVQGASIVIIFDLLK